MSIRAAGPMMAVPFTNPFDVAKCRMQMQNELQRRAPTTARTYKHTIDCIIQTWRAEGVAGVQRGLPVALVRDGVKCFFRIGLYEPVHAALMASYLGRDDATALRSPPPLWLGGIAGMTSGFVAAVLCNPLDLLKTQVQSSGVATAHHQYSGALHAFRGIASKGGLPAFWAGTPVNVARSMVFSAVMLPTNARVKATLARDGGLRPGMLRDALASFLSSAVGIFIMNPVDVIRTRLYNQPRAADGRGAIYGGVLDAMWKVGRAEGPLAFWKGFFAHYLRAGPHTVLSFTFIGVLQRHIASPSY